MLRYFILYKPFNVLNQFTDPEGRPTLAGLSHFPAEVYPVGRLDMDSEGLLLLTNDKHINYRLLQPHTQHEKEYLVQVDGDITEAALTQLRQGITLRIDKKDYRTLPAKARKLSQEPNLPPRNPPIRYRANIPTSWISLAIHEGKNRQVRRMTAQVGFPTLRLVRVRIQGLYLGDMQPGEVREITRQQVYGALFGEGKSVPRLK